MPVSGHPPLGSFIKDQSGNGSCFNSELASPGSGFKGVRKAPHHAFKNRNSQHETKKNQFGRFAKPVFEVNIFLPDAAVGVFGREWAAGPKVGPERS